MRTILVTRPAPAGPELAEKLRREGFKVFYAPLSVYVPQKTDLSALAECQALAFTSAQAVGLFAGQSDRRDLPVFAVGEATAKSARAAGFTRVLTGGGNVRDLAEVLRGRKEELGIRKILHVAGEEVAEDLSALLAPDGIAAPRAVAYKTEAVDTLPPEVDRALIAGEITTVLLFSARAAQQFVRMIGRPDLRNVNTRLEAVCLSDRVAAALRGLPWRSLRIARAPRLESVMDILRAGEEDADATQGALPAEPVLAAFGGIRPLANRLQLTASTVQGWKKRGMIPEARADAVIKAAQEDGMDLAKILEGQGSMTTDKETNGQQGKAPPPDAGQERRRGPDRRQQRTVFDERGFVKSTAYTGPDRRTGGDRRAHETRQQKTIRAEKWRFFNRTVIMAVFFFIAIIYGAGFLMAPEFFKLREDAARIEEMEKRFEEYERQIEQLRAQQRQHQGSIGGKINRGIEKVEDTVAAVKNGVSALAQSADQQLLQNSETYQGLQQLVQMLGMVQRLNSTAEGRQLLEEAMLRLRGAMQGAGNDAAALNEAVDAARKRDDTLKSLTGEMSAQDLGAAALLLTLNELRKNMGAGRTFEQDFAIVQKFAGGDPAMRAALQRLAPYAKSGVLSRETLQKEFSGVASDIVMAKLQGEDATVREHVLQRLGKYAKLRRVDDIQGQSVDAVVARAELMLDQGDIKGAIRELQTLEGAPAETAQPWMNQAASTLAADDSSAMVMQMLMQKLSGTSGASIETLFSDIIRQIQYGGVSAYGGAPAGGNVYPLAPPR